MINIDEINGEIAKLESQPTTYMTVEKLAWLYTVRDHNQNSVSSDKMPQCDSDFMRACQKKGISQSMAILDEMMLTIQAIHPRLFDAVMERMLD